LEALEKFGLRMAPAGSVAEDYEAELADINFTRGRLLSQGIPWQAYTELEIQILLKMHFEMLDYEVTWRHREDPANEDGIDLECVHGSDKGRVLVAVKKKPKKEALAQVVQLARHQANQRIYVYVGGAAQSFRDEIIAFKPKVEFWNEEVLESEFNETGQTLRLKMANAKANDAMLGIMRSLIAVIKRKNQVPPPSKPTPEMMHTLWAMKDRAVTVNHCASLAQLMLEDPSRFGKPSHEQVQNLVIYVLDYIYAYGLLSLRKAFEDMPMELQSILAHVHEKTKIRSNWLELYQYYRGAVPGNVERVYQDFEKERAKWKGLTKDLESAIKKRKVPEIVWTHLDDAAELFRQLNVWSDGLEGTIDYMFNYCVRGEVHG
jgi:hypothetical protein